MSIISETKNSYTYLLNLRGMNYTSLRYQIQKNTMIFNYTTKFFNKTITKAIKFPCLITRYNINKHDLFLSIEVYKPKRFEVNLLPTILEDEVLIC
jgi:hypothetical protein